MRSRRTSLRSALTAAEALNVPGLESLGTVLRGFTPAIDAVGGRRMWERTPGGRGGRPTRGHRRLSIGRRSSRDHRTPARGPEAASCGVIRPGRDPAEVGLGRPTGGNPIEAPCLPFPQTATRCGAPFSALGGRSGRVARWRNGRGGRHRYKWWRTAPAVRGSRIALRRFLQRYGGGRHRPPRTEAAVPRTVTRGDTAGCRASQAHGTATRCAARCTDGPNRSSTRQALFFFFGGRGAGFYAEAGYLVDGPIPGGSAPDTAASRTGNRRRPSAAGRRPTGWRSRRRRCCGPTGRGEGGSAGRDPRRFSHDVRACASRRPGRSTAAITRNARLNPLGFVAGSSDIGHYFARAYVGANSDKHNWRASLSRMPDAIEVPLTITIRA